MSSPPDKIKVAFSVTNCICHDQRVLKMAALVSNLDCDITIIGRKKKECRNSEPVSFRTKRFGMIFKRGFLFYMFFNIRLFFYLAFKNFNLLVSNDLDTLLPCFLISKLRKIPLVYDSHEYFTGVPEIQNRPFVKWIWMSIERSVFPYLKYVMTVSDSIAVQYEHEYGLRPVTVRNCSMSTGNLTPFTHEELGIDPGNLLLILQGTGINIDRGGEELIDAVNLTPDVSLLIVGSGDQLEYLTRKVITLGLKDRIRFIPKCPWLTLMKYTRSADVGLSLDKDSNLNYKFSLPNKLFDYISAGIPVIASDLTEISGILSEFNCGIVIPEVTPEEISKTIIVLRDNRTLLSELKRNSATASESLNWATESQKAETLYSSILKKL